MQFTEQAVRERAYYIWEGEGRVHGRAAIHWHRAETELAAAQPAVVAEPAKKAAKPAAKTAAKPAAAKPVAAKPVAAKPAAAKAKPVEAVVPAAKAARRRRPPPPPSPPLRSRRPSRPAPVRRCTRPDISRAGERPVPISRGGPFAFSASGTETTCGG